MAYLLGQILFCLFFAAMIGFAVGWLFRGAPRDGAPAEGPVQRLHSADPAPGGGGEEADAVRSENRALRARLEEGLARVRQIEKNMAAQADAAAENLAAERERSGALEERLENTQAALAEKARAFASQEAHLAKQSATLQVLEKRLASNAEAIKSANKMAEQGKPSASVAAGTARIVEQIETMDARLGDYDADSRRHNQKLESISNGIAAIGEHAATLKAELATARQKLAAESNAADPALAPRLANAREQLTRLQNELLERDQLIAELRDRQASAPEERQHELPIASPDHGGRPAWLIEQPDGQRDDLKKIYGIGPVLERTLNDLGVFHFRQIAALSAADVAWLAAHINSFPDRIIRDRWVEQARDLIGNG